MDQRRHSPNGIRSGWTNASQPLVKPTGVKSRLHVRRGKPAGLRRVKLPARMLVRSTRPSFLAYTQDARITRRFPPCSGELCGSIRMSRTVQTLLFFLFAIIATAQTPSDLAARYGDPAAERFVVRPGITMMASYAED